MVVFYVGGVVLYLVGDFVLLEYLYCLRVIGLWISMLFCSGKLRWKRGVEYIFGCWLWWFFGGCCLVLYLYLWWCYFVCVLCGFGIVVDCMYWDVCCVVGFVVFFVLCEIVFI